MRMNQLPIPANGASTARFGRRTPPSPQGWSTTRVTPVRAGPLPDEAPPGGRQQVVDVVELVAERGDRRRQAAGRDRGGLEAELLGDAPDYAVDLAREAVDDP